MPHQCGQEKATSRLVEALESITVAEGGSHIDGFGRVFLKVSS